MSTTTTPATYADALANGYRDGRQAWERGYVSRKADPKKAGICTARNGELYVLLASDRSSRYCIRQYLVAKH